MKTILQVNTVANWGSTGHIAEEIGDTAMQYGFESYIAYGRLMNGMVPQSTSKLIRIGNELDIIYHGIASILFDKQGRASKNATRKFLNLVDTINPDIIHLHNIHGYYLNYPILFDYLKRTGVPVIWTLHDCWPFTGHCAYFSQIKCKRWENQCFKCPLKDQYPRSLIDNSTSNYLQKKEIFTSIENLTVVPVSGWLESVVKESFLRECNIKTICNGIDTNKFRYKSDCQYLRNKLGLNQEKIILGVATTWDERKGLKDYHKLRRLLPIDKYKIVLVGLNNKQIKELPAGIYGITRTNNLCELIDYYSLADIVLNLSYQETFGLTTVEGLSCGTPGIVYNATASPELIDDNTGIIVEPGRVDDVAKAVVEICNKGKSLYSVACRKRAVNLYDKTLSWNKYIEMYKSLTE